MPPIFYSDPMPGEKRERREDGEDGENNEDRVENPDYNPGFENLSEVPFQGEGDKLINGTIEDQQENVVAKNFTEQRAQNVSIEDQKHSVKANYNGEQAIIQSGRDKDPSIEDAIKSATSDEGDTLAKKEALDSFITRQAMYTDVLGDQVARSKASGKESTNEEEAAKASAELDAVLSAGNSLLNQSTGNTREGYTQESRFTDEHLKRTLDEAAEIKAKTDVKINGEADVVDDGVTDEETDYETVESDEESTEDNPESPESSEATPEAPTTDTPGENLPTDDMAASAEQKIDTAEAKQATPVFLNYDDQPYDPGEAIYGAMVAKRQEEDQTKEKAEQK